MPKSRRLPCGITINLYEKYLLPHFLNRACGLKPISHQRQKVVPLAKGTVLEIAIGSDLNAYKASANSQMNYMKSDYSSGIASAVAMSQFNLAQDGFSIGIGRGSYNDEDETAFGLGYGGEFKNGTLFKLQASKSGDASGVGLTISF